jgi:hypothetical protein
VDDILGAARPDWFGALNPFSTLLVVRPGIPVNGVPAVVPLPKLETHNCRKSCGQELV